MKIIKLSLILMSYFALDTHVLVSMKKGNPEEEVKKIENIARKLTAEKRWSWGEFLSSLVSIQEEPKSLHNKKSGSYIFGSKKN